MSPCCRARDRLWLTCHTPALPDFTDAALDHELRLKIGIDRRATTNDVAQGSKVLLAHKWVACQCAEDGRNNGDVLLKDGGLDPWTTSGHRQALTLTFSRLSNSANATGSKPAVMKTVVRAATERMRGLASRTSLRGIGLCDSLGTWMFKSKAMA